MRRSLKKERRILDCYPVRNLAKYSHAFWKRGFPAYTCKHIHRYQNLGY
jgi:hypothetical protein